MNIRNLRFVALALLTLTAYPALALDTRIWNGSQSSDWMNTNNWNTPFIPASTGVVSNTRMEVRNTSNNELIYHSSMGTTVFAGIGGSGLNPRSVIIGLASSGQLRITGGILEGRGYATGGGVADLIGGNGATGRLIVDGGTYLRTNDVPVGTTEFGAEMVIGYSTTAGTTGELIVSNGLASVRHIVLNFNNGLNVSSIIRLDGGVLETYAIRSGGTNGTRAVYFNGGTLRAAFTTPTDWITSSINTWVQNGGAIFDTADYSCTLLSHLAPEGASTGGLVKNGNGLLKLSGTNTYTGVTTINSGTLQVPSPISLAGYSTAGKLSVASGATLHLNISTSNEWASADIDNLLSNNGSGFSIGSKLGFDTSNGNTTNSSNIAAININLVKTGGNTLLLNGVNTYTGLTTVASGVLRIEHGNALGTSASGTVLANGTRVEMDGGFTVSGEPLTISGTGGGDSLGALLSVSGTNTWDGPIILGADQSRLGANGGHLVVKGPIGDNGNNYSMIIRNFNGNLTDTVTLSGANTYGGKTMFYQGAIKLDGGNNRLPIGTLLQLGYYVTGNSLIAQLDLNGCDQEVAGLEVHTTVTTESLRTSQMVKNASETPAILTLRNTADYTFTGRLVGNLGLTKKGAGMFTLSNTNTYSGVTGVSNGTLRLTRSDCLSTNAPISIDTSASAKVDLAFTGTQTVSTLSVDGKVLFRNFVYNAANIPTALSGTGNLRTTAGPILGAMVQFF